LYRNTPGPGIGLFGAVGHQYHSCGLDVGFGRILEYAFEQLLWYLFYKPPDASFLAFGILIFRDSTSAQSSLSFLNGLYINASSSTVILAGTTAANILSLLGAMLTKVKSTAAHLGQAEKAVEDEVEQEPGLFLDNSASLWTSDFCNSRNIDAIREDINTPLVEVYDAVLTESGERESVDDDVRHAESGGTKSLIQRFMHDCDTSDVVSPQADTVEDYSFRASLDLLKAESWTGQELPRNAWLGEGGDGWFRPCAEWLTAYDLYKALRKPVSQISP
jgi:hypothetical protein